jgi:hypothetical protein
MRKRWWFRLHETSGKRREVPVISVEEYPNGWIGMNECPIRCSVYYSSLGAFVGMQLLSVGPRAAFT